MKFENTKEVLYEVLVEHGIKYDKKIRKYKTTINNQGKTVSLGYYIELQDAQNVVYQYKYNRINQSIIQNGLNINESKIVNRYYIVFKTGDIFNLYGQKLKGGIDPQGYCYVHDNKNHEFLYRHRVVAIGFIPNPNNMPEVNHKDGNPTNNNIDNLEWCNRSENILHAYRTGLEKKVLGEDHHNNKLSEEQVIYIKRNYKPRDPINGATALGKKFGVTRFAIQDIAREKSWGWLNAI